MNFNSPFWFFIFHYVAWCFYALWLLFSIFYIIRSTRKPEKINFYLFESIPSVFVSIGLLGTFLGITHGLINFNVDPDHIKESIKLLIGSLRFAFLISIAGIFGSLISSKFVKHNLHVYHKIQPPASPELIELTQINESLKALKSTLVDNESQQKVNFQKFVKEIKDSNDWLALRLDEFVTKLADANSTALLNALESVINDFNDTIKDFIQTLVDKNFQQLTESVKNLNVWQQENKSMINMLRENYEVLVNDTSHIVASLKNMVQLNDQLVGQNSRLQAILEALGKVLVDDKRYVELVNKLQSTTDNLVVVSNTLTDTAENIEQVASDNKTLTESITNWFEGEIGVKASIIELNRQLSQLERVKLEDLRLLDTSFNTRLQTTFQNLDELLKEYIYYIETKTNGKAKV